ncbi:simple sugar transport system ATP-binding protein [Amycolatopsis tolypomycina]|uniref:Simple sugar transport system ATP-binding protein n=2 Tax=Amycolatopsis tolypomycina TaxID=208445 RepID=A0A1H4WDD7_9PSEU|nr:simple sugar transport system ATP-binding protein [Amycolatopsis tolypomycina]
MPEPQPMVRMSGIRKEFPGVLALDGVAFRMYPGEVHALMGENGAGKSTLIKVLTGVYGVDAGTIELGGGEVAFSGPGEAQQAGISTVYQEVNLCPNLSVAENVCLGREPRRFGRIQWGPMRKRAEELLARLDVHVDVSAELSTCSIAVQQLVAIARALDVDARVLVLDEPTSSLDAGEVEQLLKVVRSLRESGMAILFVSHFIDQVFAIADRMTVLRNGKLIGEYRTADITPVELVTKMIGKELQVLEDLEDSGPTRAEVAGAPVLLAAEGLGRKGGVAPFDLTVHAGEVVGLAGLLGSGRTELARLLFGADHADSGTVQVDGDTTSLRTPRAGLDHKIAFLSENRKAEGLVEELTVRENIVLALQASRGWARPLSRRRQDEIAEKYVKALDIRPANPEALVGNLSGGNQQKVLLARWLITEPRLLILDEPTRGIDIGAKTEIQKLVTQLSGEGMAVVYISAELEEVLRLSHRVVVLRDRKVVAVRDNNQALTADDVMATMAEGVQA